MCLFKKTGFDSMSIKIIQIVKDTRLVFGNNYAYFTTIIPKQHDMRPTKQEQFKLDVIYRFLVYRVQDEPALPFHLNIFHASALVCM